MASGRRSDEPRLQQEPDNATQIPRAGAAARLRRLRPGGIPALGITGCQFSGIGIGAAGGALAGALIGRSWTEATIGGAAGAATGYAITKFFAHELNCDDQKRLVQTTQTAAIQPTSRRVPITPSKTTDGQTVTGYVMPVDNWHTGPDGRKVRTVRQVLTDGHNTQTSTVEVAANDVDTSGKGGGYVLPK